MYHSGVVIDLLLSDGRRDLLSVPSRLAPITFESGLRGATKSSNNRASNTPHVSPTSHYSFCD